MFGNNIFPLRNRYKTLYIAYTEKTNKHIKNLKYFNIYTFNRSNVV